MDLLTIDVDARTVIAAIDALGREMVDAHLRPAVLETGRAVQTEISRRMARSRDPKWGSHLADHVQLQERTDARGPYVVVFVNDETGLHPTNLDLWLEFGTVHMSPHPAAGAVLPAARLEEAPHERRVIAALNDAIQETGFGA